MHISSQFIIAASMIIAAHIISCKNITSNITYCQSSADLHCQSNAHLPALASRVKIRKYTCTQSNHSAINNINKTSCCIPFGNNFFWEFIWSKLCQQFFCPFGREPFMLKMEVIIHSMWVLTRFVFGDRKTLR